MSQFKSTFFLETIFSKANLPHCSSSEGYICFLKTEKFEDLLKRRPEKQNIVKMSCSTKIYQKGDFFAIKPKEYDMKY